MYVPMHLCTYMFSIIIQIPNSYIIESVYKVHPGDQEYVILYTGGLHIEVYQRIVEIMCWRTDGREMMSCRNCPCTSAVVKTVVLDYLQV